MVALITPRGTTAEPVRTEAKRPGEGAPSGIDRLPPQSTMRSSSPALAEPSSTTAIKGPEAVAWVSDIDTIEHVAFYDTADVEGLSADLSVAASLNLQGDVVPKICIPSAVRPMDPDQGEIDPDSHEYHEMAELKELTLIANRFVLVGPRLAAVLSRFDLGTGALHPIAVLDPDGAVMSEGTYFFWNFGNKRSCFLPDESNGIERSNYGAGRDETYTLPLLPPGDSIALSRDCLTGPDVWREKDLNKGTFLSDRLVRALREADLDDFFELVRCRVV